MTRVLQLSDIHFGTERADVVESLVEHAHALRPDVLVVSGDLTQRAMADQFAAARRFVDRLAVPVVLTLPGNHDIPLFAVWTRLLVPYRRYRRHFGDERGFVHAGERLLLIGVNSARHLRHKNGALNERQIEAVAARLETATADQISIVALHHPVHATRERNERDLVRNGERAVRRWAAAGADLVLGGHLHLPYSAALSARYPDLPRRCWCVQAGTATSARTREGAVNSLNVIDIVDRSIRVERHDCDARTRTFACVASEVLAVERDGGRAARAPV